MFQTICLMGIAVHWVSISCLFSIKANTHCIWRRCGRCGVSWHRSADPVPHTWP